MVIWGSTQVNSAGGTGPQSFIVSPKMVDTGKFTASRALLTIPAGGTAHKATNTALPVSAGEHTVTLNVEMTVGDAGWQYNRNNLAVMFVPAGRGVVTDTAAESLG